MKIDTPDAEPLHHLILWAEDDKDDRYIFLNAFSQVQCQFEIRFVTNGLEVLDFLEQQPSRQYPSLIVLDLNMPQLDGWDTLRHIRANPDYATIPAVVVSTSIAAHQTHLGEKLSAQMYTKPDAPDDVLLLVLDLLLQAGAMMY